MTNYKEYYKNELDNKTTKYFILDTGPGTHGDVDFESYNWETDKFNRMREGDLFIYRRQQKASEIKGQFYFFGAGKIEKIESMGGKKVKALISRPMIFKDKLLQKDLDNFKWIFKTRGLTWEHFFNQYGMNIIAKGDFVNLLHLVEGRLADGEQIEVEQLRIEVDLYQRQQKGEYRVEDKKGLMNIRGPAQKIFADQVKANYGYKCVITGIGRKEFLVGSHIIPWAIDKNNRLNPRNGLCLSLLVDKAFDKGFLTITREGIVLLSDALKVDKALYKILEPYKGLAVRNKSQIKLSSTFLDWHNKNVFIK